MTEFSFVGICGYGRRRRRERYTCPSEKMCQHEGHRYPGSLSLVVSWVSLVDLCIMTPTLTPPSEPGSDWEGGTVITTFRCPFTYNS